MVIIRWTMTEQITVVFQFLIAHVKILQTLDVLITYINEHGNIMRGNDSRSAQLEPKGPLENRLFIKQQRLFSSSRAFFFVKSDNHKSETNKARNISTICLANALRLH